MASTALLGCVAVAHAAPAADGSFVIAQANTGAGVPATSGEGVDALEQITVTATRQESTVNRVPLSIAAATQRTLDQQGVKTVSDLQRTVPALQVQGDSTGASNFTIRGIRSTVGAATTGVYLNDIPIQKRRIGGSQNSAPGGAAPPLFDLERVEVLRGPQGTLYGGSSQGGTIRFITPTPSLTTYSGRVMAEASGSKYGDLNYEGGVAIGGPIVKDKLAFRASILGRRMGGYVDIVDPYNGGAMKFENANEEKTRSAHLTILWAPTERARVTIDSFGSIVKGKGGPDSWLLPQPDGKTYTTLTQCYDTRVPVAPAANPPRMNCPSGVLPSYIYRRPGVTYGPFDYLDKPYQSFQQKLDPARTQLETHSLTLDYTFDHMAVRSITSYVHDQLIVVQGGDNSTVPAEGFTTDYPNANGFILFAQEPYYHHWTQGRNKRHGIVQEIRFSSIGNESPLTWVGGVYYSNFSAYSAYFTPWSLSHIAQVVYGRPDALSAFGVPETDSAVTRNQSTKDIELAAFGEANYQITDKLKATAGIRVSRVEFSYEQIYFGNNVGWLDPFANPLGHTVGTTVESPVTPKLGLSYNLTPDNMVYVSASKGYRSGGVNNPTTENLCGRALANIGLTINDVPADFGSDTIWSYEAGAKLRLFGGRAQVNGSVFKIDWTNLQLAVPNLGSGCRGGWVQNAGKAVSQGFDIDVQARLFNALTVNFAAGYTDAKYTENSTLPPPLNGSPATVIVRKGDTLPVAPWQVSAGVRYDFKLAGLDAFVRGDYAFTDSYLNGSAPGVTGFAADQAYTDQLNSLNVRAGLAIGNLQIDAFVNNVTNSKDASGYAGGRSGCAVATGAACTTFTTFQPFITVNTRRPREFGVRTEYRF